MCSGACAQGFLFISLKALLLQAIRTLIQIHVLQQASHYTTSLHVLLDNYLSFSATDESYLLLVVYRVIQFVIGLRKLCLAAVLRGCNRIIWAKD